MVVPGRYRVGRWTVIGCGFGGERCVDDNKRPRGESQLINSVNVRFGGPISQHHGLHLLNNRPPLSMWAARVRANFVRSMSFAMGNFYSPPVTATWRGGHHVTKRNGMVVAYTTHYLSLDHVTS
ncbi:hypothetical protein J6590_023895 [Homalodisca vitripennis]|nr:hypothetical protein J6590_023895 [Homalodisca vitripennis]